MRSKHLNRLLSQYNDIPSKKTFATNFERTRLGMSRAFYFYGKNMSTPIKKRLSLKEFEEYVAKKDFGKLPPTFLIIHHTWNPTKESWKGKTTLDGIDNYYRGLGWGGLGPHLFTAEDGIWLFTDMYEVGIHAGAGNGTLKTGYSVGIEVVGNYDNEVWSGATYSNTIGAINALTEKLKIPQNKIMFHRDYSSKTCPGKAITKEWLFNQLNKKDVKKEIREWAEAREKNQGFSTKEEWWEYAYKQRSEISELEKKIDEFKKELSQEKDKHKKEIESLDTHYTEHLNSFKLQRTQLEDKLGKQAIALSELDGQKYSLEKKISSLEEELKTKNIFISDEILIENSDLKRDAEASSKKIKELEEKLAVKNEEIADALSVFEAMKLVFSVMFKVFKK